MNEHHGYFNRRSSSHGENSDQHATTGTRRGGAPAVSRDVPEAVSGHAPAAGPSADGAGTPPRPGPPGGEGASAAELEREARRLEQAAVDAADVVRQSVAAGRRVRLGELQRKADRLFDQAIHARLRADEAVAGVGEDAPAAGPQQGGDGAAIPVITWNRPELDWTSLVAAAIEKTDESPEQAAQRSTSAAAYRPQRNGTRVDHGPSPSPPSGR